MDDQTFDRLTKELMSQGMSEIQAEREMGKKIHQIIMDAENKKCFGQWIYLRILGRGFNNTVYQVCRQDDCEYALKVVTVHEAETTKSAGDAGIGPTVYDIIL